MAESAVMVVNSPRSDVLPVIAAGGYGEHGPRPMTWALEHADAPTGDARVAALPDRGAMAEHLQTCD